MGYPRSFVYGRREQAGIGVCEALEATFFLSPADFFGMGLSHATQRVEFTLFTLAKYQLLAC